MARKFFDELTESWKAFQDEEHFELDVADVNRVVKTLGEHQQRYGDEQKNCFHYIQQALCTGPNLARLADEASITEEERRDARMLQLFEEMHLTNENRFARSSVENRAACLSDLAAMFLEKDRIGKLNPFLTKECIDEVHRVITLYLELEVLAEKFSRILSMHCGMAVGTDGETTKSPSVMVSSRVKENVIKNAGLIAQELLCVRNWCTTEHPYLLAFEVENRLQIRPQQYDIFLLCVNHPNAIAQLNMGEGKTRVIVPMLILYYTTRKNAEEETQTLQRRIMRITVLRPLLGEFEAYLKQTLQHSVFQKRVYVTPFNRDVDLRCAKNARCLYDTYVECAWSGGVLIETPESRMSKMLKYYELQMELEASLQSGVANSDVKEAVEKLKGVVYFPACDVLDEADEELKQK